MFSILNFLAVWKYRSKRKFNEGDYVYNKETDVSTIILYIITLGLYAMVVEKPEIEVEGEITWSFFNLHYVTDRSHSGYTLGHYTVNHSPKFIWDSNLKESDRCL